MFMKNKKSSEKRQLFHDTELYFNRDCNSHLDLVCGNNPEDVVFEMLDFSASFYIMLLENNPDNVDNFVEWEYN